MSTASRHSFNSRNSLYVYSIVGPAHSNNAWTSFLLILRFSTMISSCRARNIHIQWRFKHLLIVDMLHFICNCLCTIHFAEQTELMPKVSAASALVGQNGISTKNEKEVNEQQKCLTHWRRKCKQINMFIPHGNTRNMNSTRTNKIQINSQTGCFHLLQRQLQSSVLSSYSSTKIPTKQSW